MRSWACFVGVALVPVLAAADHAPAPRRYVALATAQPPMIDGRLDEGTWAGAAWSEDFVDIEGPSRPAPRLRTRVKMAWDENALYVAAELAEPDLWATITRRDAVIFHDDDFEVFLDPDGDGRTYFELEINALGTVWDLFLPVRYREGGKARDAFDMAGLRSAVARDGTLNDPRDRDRGWRIELAIPFRSLATAEVTTRVPRDGEAWKVNFSRVDWDLESRAGGYAKVLDPATGKPRPEANWVWSPQGVIDMHLPERWGVVVFRSAGARRE